jgi:hypothetical protein
MPPFHASSSAAVFQALFAANIFNQNAPHGLRGGEALRQPKLGRTWSIRTLRRLDQR